MTSDDDHWQGLSRYAEPRDSPGFLMWLNFMRWQRELNAELRPLGLTQPKFAILAVCAWLARDGRSITQQGVVDSLTLDRMHVSQVLSRLESAGLIVRRRQKDDARAKCIVLTEKGRERLSQAMPLVEAFDQRFFSRSVD